MRARVLNRACNCLSRRANLHHSMRSFCCLFAAIRLLFNINFFPSSLLLLFGSRNFFFFVLIGFWCLACGSIRQWIWIEWLAIGRKILRLIAGQQSIKNDRLRVCNNVPHDHMDHSLSLALVISHFCFHRRNNSNKKNPNIFGQKINLCATSYVGI